MFLVLARIEEQVGNTVTSGAVEILLLPVGVPIGQYLGTQEVDSFLQSRV